MYLLPHVSISLLPYFVPTCRKDHSLSQQWEEGTHFLPCALRRISVRPPLEEEQLQSKIPGNQGQDGLGDAPCSSQEQQLSPTFACGCPGSLQQNQHPAAPLGHWQSRIFPPRPLPSSDPILSQHCHVAGHGKHWDCVQEVKTEALSAELAI